VVPLLDEIVHEPKTPALISCSVTDVRSDEPQIQHEAFVLLPVPPMFGHSMPPVQIVTVAARCICMVRTRHCDSGCNMQLVVVGAESQSGQMKYHGQVVGYWEGGGRTLYVTSPSFRTHHDAKSRLLGERTTPKV
jgi:hypothetical protein